MCGIAGIFGAHTTDDLSAMSAAIAHRGPDGDGIWRGVDPPVGLVHRRLSIIDLSANAAQPMASADGRYVTVFNGEIYNFKELGRQLTQRGYVFNENSDTGILAPLFDWLGENMLERLNGIFSFAIWDKARKRLFIARDSVGTKPLYYVVRPPGLAFASELKALMPLRDWCRDIDVSAALEYMTYLWTPGERTLFQAVKKLPPGHFIMQDSQGMSVRRWYQIPAPRPHDKNTDPAAVSRTFVSLFDRVVSDQCLSDVPIGAFLSGGVDSTAIVSAMTRTGHMPRKTYCVHFDGKAMKEEGFENDVDYAKIAANALGVPLDIVRVDEPRAEDFERMVDTLDEPQADPAPLFVAEICARARAEGIKVMLSGTGGDDVFSGYRRHKAAHLRSLVGERWGKFASAPARAVPLAGALGRRLRRFGAMMKGTQEEFIESAFHFNDRAQAIDCLAVANQGLAQASRNAYWADGLASTRGWPLLERVLHMEFFGFLPDLNLNYTDKASMARQIEVRVPFLDTRLIDFASQLPVSLKTQLAGEKLFLKRAFSGMVPDAILRRSKTGFGGPVREWVKGKLRPFVGDIVASQSFRQRGLFDANAVDEVFASTLKGRTDGAYLLLSIVLIEIWLRRFVDLDRAQAQIAA